MTNSRSQMRYRVSISANDTAPELTANARRLLLALALLVAIFALIALPTCLLANHARGSARLKACVSNMKAIEGAIQFYDMEHVALRDEAPSMEQLLKGGYLKTIPTCLAGGEYKTETCIGTGGSLTIGCTLHGTIENNHIVGYEDTKIYIASRLEELAVHLFIAAFFIGSFYAARFCFFRLLKIAGMTFQCLKNPASSIHTSGQDDWYPGAAGDEAQNEAENEVREERYGMPLAAMSKHSSDHVVDM
jgi:hypothetical protein